MSSGILSRLRLSARGLRWLMNVWPPFVGAGIHVLRIAPDYRAVDVRLRHGVLNRNYFGTHYGGSLFSMTDPFYAIMLLHNLPPGYVVWDKAASIEFKVPGRGDVFARFRLADEQIADVATRTASGDKYEPTWTIDVVDANGEVVATVAKTLYVRCKQP